MKRSFRSRFPTSFRPRYRPPHSASNRRRRKALRPAVPAGCPFRLRPVRRRRFCAVDLSLSFPRLHRRERRPAAPLLPVISVRSSQKENIHETIVPAQAQKSEFSGNRIAHRQYFRPLLPENRPSSLRLLAGRAPRRPRKPAEGAGPLHRIPARPDSGRRQKHSRRRLRHRPQRRSAAGGGI